MLPFVSETRRALYLHWNGKDLIFSTVIPLISASGPFFKIRRLKEALIGRGAFLRRRGGNKNIKKLPLGGDLMFYTPYQHSVKYFMRLTNIL